jgi:hypothetical protein
MKPVVCHIVCAAKQVGRRTVIEIKPTLKVGTILNASLRIGELVQLKDENPPPSAPTAAEA